MIAELDASRSVPPARVSSVRAGVSAGVGFPVLWSVGPRLQVAPSFGYEWFFGSHVAIELDGGFATTLSHKVKDKRPRESCEGEWCDFDLDLPSVHTLPSLHLGLVAYF